MVSQSTNQTEWFDGVDGQLSSSSLGVDTNKLVSDNLGNLYFSQHGNGNNNTNGLYYNNFNNASGFPNVRKISVSSTNLATNIIDTDFSTFTRTSKSSNSFIDVTFDKPYDVSALSSVVAYSSNLGNTNPLIGKISIESTTNNSLDISEIQVWYDNSNVAKVVDVSSSNMFDGSILTSKLKHGPDSKHVKVARLNKVTPAVTETLVATKSVTMHQNYNGGLMNFPQSIFNGAMGSNTRTVSGLTGNLALFNGSYSISWSPNLTVPYWHNPAHFMFSATDSDNRFGDSDSVSIQFLNNNMPYDSNGDYTGNNYITYQDDDGNSINANGEWFAFEFPAYINFTKVHHICLDARVNTFTWIGRDKNGTNRLLGTYIMSWTLGYWRSAALSNNYYVNKIYLVIGKRNNSQEEYIIVNEIFFDGNYLVSEQSSEQDDFYNDGTNTLYNNSLVDLNTWAGSNTIYVTKLYNQSSIKTTPLIQPVEANQPTIDISNLKINFDGTNSFMYA